MKMYSVKATASIRLRVDYQCSFCDKVNSDDDQYIVASAQSGGSLYSSNKQSVEAKQSVARILQDKITDVSKGDWQSAHLTCVCPSCGKRQVWASFIKYPVWAIILFCVGIISLISALSSLGQLGLASSIAVILVLFLIFFLPLIIIAVHNLLIKSKVSRLDPKYLPKISFIPK